MRQRMGVQPLDPLPRFVAGADAAFSDDKSTTFDQPALEAGCVSPFMDSGERIGSVLRTRRATRPVFIHNRP